MSRRSATRIEAIVSCPAPDSVPPTRDQDVDSSMPSAPSKGPFRSLSDGERAAVEDQVRHEDVEARGHGRKHGCLRAGCRSSRCGRGRRSHGQALEAPLAALVSEQRDVRGVEADLRDLEPASQERKEAGADDERLGSQELAGDSRGIADRDLSQGGAREQRDVHPADGHRRAQGALGGADGRPPEGLGVEIPGEGEEAGAQQGDRPEDDDGQDLEGAHRGGSRSWPPRGRPGFMIARLAVSAGRNRSPRGPSNSSTTADRARTLGGPAKNCSRTTRR